MRKRKTGRLLKKVLVSVLAAAMLVTAPGTANLNVKAADSDVVEIPDANFKARLNRALGVADETADITKGQLARIKRLTGLDTITNIQGIEYCVNLESFGTFLSPGLTDITPLKNLTKLNYVRLYDSGVTDLSPLDKLTNLTTLDLQDSKNISDITVTAKLPNLTYLNVHNTAVTDLSSIKDLTNLEKLDIGFCENVTDISALEKLTKLTELDMSRCSKVTDVSTLGTLVNLQTLYLDYVKAADISAIHNLTGLKLLSLYYCSEVTDVSPLSGLANLEYLELEHTGLANVAPENRRGTIDALSTLENMKDFSWSYADVTDEEAAIIFKNMNQLEIVRLGVNNLTDASFLLPSKESLKNLTLAANLELEDTETIKQLKNLTIVGVDATKITDFSFISALPKMTNSSIRFAEWTEHFPTKTRTELNVFIEDGSNQVTYDNCVRNEKGELVAPDAKDGVTYDMATGKITVEIGGNHYENVQHTLNMTTRNGNELYARHTTEIYDRTIDIKTQPSNQEVEETASCTLGVSAATRYNYNTDSKGLTYQWYKDGVAIAGATASSYKIDSVSAAEAGNYHVVISNEWGSVTSEAATVSVKEVEQTPLAITKEPTDITLDEGATGSISVVATGDGLTYQWYKDGNAVAGATNASLNLSNVTAADEGNYKVIVTDAYGNSVTSNTVAVTINERAELTIMNHPTDEVLNEGESTTLSVYAEGEAPLTYQWYKDGVAIEGATEASLNLSNVTAADAGSYKVIVTDAYGETAESNAATITVNVPTPLAITKQPESITLDKGTNGSLTVEATGDGLAYQWYKEGVAITGETSATLNLTDVTKADEGTYKVTIKDAYDGMVMSDNVTVTVVEKTPLVITKQPTALTLDEGANGSLTVEATGDGLAYQWYKEGVAIEGVTEATLGFTEVKAEDAGTYKVVVSDKYGVSVTSEEVKVTVTVKEEPENPEPVDPEPVDPENPEPEQPEEPNTPETEKPSDTPKTGDTSSPMLYIVIMGCAVLAAVAAMRKRRAN